MSESMEQITRNWRDRAGWRILVRCAARMADHHSWWDRERWTIANVRTTNWVWHIDRLKDAWWTSRVTTWRPQDKRPCSQAVERRPGQILERHDMAENSTRRASMEVTCWSLRPNMGYCGCPMMTKHMYRPYINVHGKLVQTAARGFTTFTRGNARRTTVIRCSSNEETKHSNPGCMLMGCVFWLPRLVKGNTSLGIRRTRAFALRNKTTQISRHSCEHLLTRCCWVGGSRTRNCLAINNYVRLICVH